MYMCIIMFKISVNIPFDDISHSGVLAIKFSCYWLDVIITHVKAINKINRINKNLQNFFEVTNIIDHLNVMTQVIQIHFVYKRDEILDRKL